MSVESTDLNDFISEKITKTMYVVFKYEDPSIAQVNGMDGVDPSFLTIVRNILSENNQMSITFINGDSDDSDDNDDDALPADMNLNLLNVQPYRCVMVELYEENGIYKFRLSKCSVTYN